jgi:hypothetical protein
MANDGNHSNSEERGVQALWAAMDAREYQFLRMERSIQVLQQAVAGLGVDGNRNHEHYRNHDHKEARGHPIGEHGPRHRRGHWAFEGSSSVEDPHFREEVGGRRRPENSHSFQVKSTFLVLLKRP